MTNLEKIRKAWSMGWSAVIKLETGTIFTAICEGVTCGFFGFRDDSFQMATMLNIQDGKADQYKFKITGYKYAGELAGNEMPDLKQKFKIKSTGKIIQLSGYLWDDVDDWKNDCIQYDEDEEPVNKSEIEPVF